MTSISVLDLLAFGVIDHHHQHDQESHFILKLILDYS